MSEKSIYNPSWNFFHLWWGKVEPPWRPNKNDIKFCEKMIKMVMSKEKAPKALVMGATPEIRDLLAKYKISTVIVDANPTMKKAMDKLMKRKNPKEKFIISDWLKIKLRKNYFNLVFSDGCFTNIALATWPKLFKIINRSLKNDALFYHAGWVYQIEKPWGFKDLIAKYKKDPIYFNDFKSRIYSLHRLMCEPGLYDRQKKELDFFKVMAGLKKFIKQGIITKADFKKLQWTDVDIGAYVEVAFDNAKEHDKVIKKYYEIIDFYQDKSHPLMSFRRDYILKPQK